MSFYLISGQAKTIVKGKIIDSVFVKNDLKESFTLYIPNNYVASNLSPIVFIFEPAARGITGIRPFIKAAEKYGYILVCSNNSKNGPFDKNFEITNRLFEKVFSDFKLDPKRIYTAGFSGGARLASAIAVLTKKIQGVIACGAGLSNVPDHLPRKESFSYAAIVGDEDMNLLEMHSTKEYEIKHKWPTQEQILRAFDWLQLEAYKKEIIPINYIVIKKNYTSFYNKARQLEKNNKLLYAKEEYSRIIENFNTYYTLDSISNRLNDLNENKNLIHKKKVLKSIFQEEIELTQMYSTRFRNDLKKKKVSLKWWESKINKLKKEETEASVEKKKMIYRLQVKIYAMIIESARLKSTYMQPDKLIFSYDICILINPKYPFLYFKQIENHINRNDITNAVNYVEKLLNSGYKNKKKILNNKDFDVLKSNERFLTLTQD